MNFKNTLLALALLFFTGGALWAQTTWHDPMEAEEPYVNGRAWNAETGKNWQRLPNRFEASLPKAVWNQSKQTAGLTVTFVSTSPTLEVRCVLTGGGGYRNMTPANHSGLDLYATDVDGRTAWVGCHMNWQNRRDTLIYRYGPFAPEAVSGRGLYFTLHLPPYNGVKHLSIGTQSGTTFRFVRESCERPIVCYGSSIIQGASAARPGNLITNIVSRELDYPVVNLGFSGSALLEPSLFELMAQIDARAYVLDPMPNSFGLDPDTVTARTVAGVKRLRAQSNAPILLVEAFLPADSVLQPTVCAPYRRGNAALRRAYEQLQREQIGGLFYLTAAELGLGGEDLVEGIHPNDLGCRKYATAYERKLAAMLPSPLLAGARFAPVRQRRDGVYEWMERHNAVLELNRTLQPEVVLIGNSITHFFGGEPQSRVNNGGQAWQKTFGKRRVVNMGFGWDRLENVAWRLLHGELADCAPKHICLLIGVNNISHNGTPQEIARGIAELARSIHNLQPQARLHVLKVLPCADRFKETEKVNALLEKTVQTGNGADLMDFTHLFTTADGRLDRTLFRGDGLHPNEAGYAKLGKALKRALKL